MEKVNCASLTPVLQISSSNMNHQFYTFKLIYLAIRW